MARLVAGGKGETMPAHRPTGPAVDTGELFGLILESAGEGIYGIDLNGLVTFMNPAAERMLGYTRTELIGQPMHLRTHAFRLDGRPYPATECPVHVSMTTGVRWTGSETFWRADGTALPVEMTSSPLLSEDETVGAVVVFNDQTAVMAGLEREAATRQAAQLSFEQARIAQEAMLELQQAMHPAQPALLDPELGVHYLAADRAGPTGGDLYDWLVLPDGTLHVSVVDVLGKGVAATKDALAVTHALRMQALAGVPLSRTVQLADELLTPAFPDLVATVVVASYTPATGQLSVVSGGHPPLLLVSATGSTSWVEPAGRAIGWPLAGSDEVATVTLLPGATAVLFTDGLIEAKRDILVGMASLASLVGLLHALPAQELAETLVRRVLGDADRFDDTLALVIRRPR